MAQVFRVERNKNHKFTIHKVTIHRFWLNARVIATPVYRAKYKVF